MTQFYRILNIKTTQFIKMYDMFKYKSNKMTQFIKMYDTVL